MAAVRIFGIDPGTRVVGYSCLELAETQARGRGGALPLAHRASNVVKLGAGNAKVKLVEAGALNLGSGPVEERLAQLMLRIDQLMERLAPAELALEEAFFGKSVQSALRIGEARGVILALAAQHALEIHQFSPATIKRSVAGHGTASKDAVARMAAQALGLKQIDGPRDVSDAVAVALCRYEMRQSFRALSE